MVGLAYIGEIQTNGHYPTNCKAQVLLLKISDETFEEYLRMMAKVKHPQLHQGFKEAL